MRWGIDMELSWTRVALALGFIAALVVLVIFGGLPLDVATPIVTGIGGLLVPSKYPTPGAQ